MGKSILDKINESTDPNDKEEKITELEEKIKIVDNRLSEIGKTEGENSRYYGRLCNEKNELVGELRWLLQNTKSDFCGAEEGDYIEFVKGNLKGQIGKVNNKDYGCTFNEKSQRKFFAFYEILHKYKNGVAEFTYDHTILRKVDSKDPRAIEFEKELSDYLKQPKEQLFSKPSAAL